jgi:hypothetical protein
MLGGAAIRVAHSLNDGEYAGETILMWDGEAERVIYFYFTTAGFYTTGTMALDDGIYTAHEMVSGDASGVTEVRSSAVMLPDGRMHTLSEYLQNGEWVPGREAYYVEDPDAEVRFRDE